MRCCQELTPSRHHEPPKGGVVIQKKQEKNWIATSITLLAMTTWVTALLTFEKIDKIP